VPIVNINLLAQVLATAETQLTDPPGIFPCSHAHQRYTAEVGGQKEVGGRLGKEDESATSGKDGRFWRDSSGKIDGGRQNCR
jgi:hypothetical protein